MRPVKTSECFARRCAARVACRRLRFDERRYPFARAVGREREDRDRGFVVRAPVRSRRRSAIRFSPIVTLSQDGTFALQGLRPARADAAVTVDDRDASALAFRCGLERVDQARAAPDAAARSTTGSRCPRGRSRFLRSSSAVSGSYGKPSSARRSASNPRIPPSATTQTRPRSSTSGGSGPSPSGDHSSVNARGRSDRAASDPSGFSRTIRDASSIQDEKTSWPFGPNDGCETAVPSTTIGQPGRMPFASNATSWVLVSRPSSSNDGGAVGDAVRPDRAALQLAPGSRAPSVTVPSAADASRAARSRIRRTRRRPRRTLRVTTVTDIRADDSARPRRSRADAARKRDREASERRRLEPRNAKTRCSPHAVDAVSGRRVAVVAEQPHASIGRRERTRSFGRRLAIAQGEPRAARQHRAGRATVSRPRPKRHPQPVVRGGRDADRP